MRCVIQYTFTPLQATSEVLAYDFYDLVGNVGGFLGLFLGVSILSLYDGAKSILLT